MWRFPAAESGLMIRVHLLAGKTKSNIYLVKRFKTQNTLMINSFDISVYKIHLSLVRAILTLFLWQEHGNKSSVGCSTRAMPWRTWGSEICSLAYCYKKTLERLLWVKCDNTWRQHRKPFQKQKLVDFTASVVSATLEALPWKVCSSNTIFCLP